MNEALKKEARDIAKYTNGMVELKDHLDAIDYFINQASYQAKQETLKAVVEKIEKTNNPYLAEHDPTSNICPCCVYDEARKDIIADLKN